MKAVFADIISIGHDSPEMSANYTHIEMSAMRKAAESMPDILAE